jgi:bifunctional non-homologous end joining protein LigD
VSPPEGRREAPGVQGKRSEAEVKKLAKFKGTSHEVEVDGRTLKLTNLEKPMYPDGDFLKAHVIDYYSKVAPAMLPHIRDRPLTLKRYPHGAPEPFFFEKRAPPHRPSWIKTAPVTHKDETVEYVVCNDRATLVWLANLAALELHPQLHLASDPERPTLIAFDLDPGLPAGLVECSEVALWIRDLLKELGLQCFPKVSGGKGMQVYVPFNTPKLAYDATKEFARGIAVALEKDQPDKVVSRMAKDLRKGKVLVDWSQNDQVKTTIAAYSLRGLQRPTAGAPLQWKEVEDTLDSEDPKRIVFEAPAVLARVEEHGDLFAPVAKLKQKLPEIA